MRPEPSFRIGHRLVINRKNNNDLTIFGHDVIAKFLWRCFVFLVTFSYWWKFHVSIITGSGVMTIYFYKGLTRNPEIGNTPAWVFPNIWRLGQIMDTKFGTDVTNQMLENAAKYQSYSFNRFWVIKEKLIGGRGGKIIPPPTQIRVKKVQSSFI